MVALHEVFFLFEAVGAGENLVFMALLQLSHVEVAVVDVSLGRVYWVGHLSTSI